LIDKETVGSIEAITPELRGVLASIGIVKGRPFNPTERQKELPKKAFLDNLCAIR